jgi:hypothetical protein
VDNLRDRNEPKAPGRLDTLRFEHEGRDDGAGDPIGLMAENAIEDRQEKQIKRIEIGSLQIADGRAEQIGRKFHYPDRAERVDHRSRTNRSNLVDRIPNCGERRGAVNAMDDVLLGPFHEDLHGLGDDEHGAGAVASAIRLFCLRVLYCSHEAFPVARHTSQFLS